MEIAPEYRLPADQKVGYIETLADRHPQITGLQPYEYLRNNGADQREAFLAGQIDHLEVAYPHLTLGSISAVSRPMETALSTLAFGDCNAHTAALYDTVEYHHGELFMVDMARRMNSATSAAERAEATDWFKLANENLYGRPEPAIFNALARDAILAPSMPQPHDDLQTAALRQELRERIGSIDETDYRPVVPSAELLQTISTFSHARFDRLGEHIDPAGRYDVAGIIGALDVSLDIVGGKQLGWRVVKVPNSSALSISSHLMEVQVGANRAPIGGAVLRGKAAHEIGIHAQLSINAQRTGRSTAESGRARHLALEEGTAVCVENALSRKFAVQGTNYYLIAGLAYGLDNHGPRNFSETHDIMWRAYALQTASAPGPLQATSFNRSRRMFRGTDFVQRGVVDLRDLSYRVGQDQAWRLLQTVRTQADFDSLFESVEIPTSRR